MDIFLAQRSLTIHIPDTGKTGHLFIILTNTCERGLNLLVPVCTVTGRFDRTCLLGVGDHKFIRHPSYVMYSKMDLYSAKHLTSQVRAGIFGYEGVLDERVFALVCAGVASSDFAAPKHQKYFADQATQRG
jgi:hypothetical protein